MEQRTNEWYLARKGKMTASECYLLLNNHKEAMTDDELAEWKAQNPKSRVTTKEVPFSDGTFTWLNRKVAECFMPDNAFIEDLSERQYPTKAMQYGTFWEPDARKAYAKALSYEVFEVGFIPLDGYEKFAGGSPDGMIREEKGIIEIKCPYSPEIHQDYLLFEKAEDLKEYNPQYYAQCQMNMVVTDTEFCDFVSFDPRTSKDRQVKVLRIPKEEAFCNLLRERIALGVEYYKERINRIKNTPNIILC